jgi:transposase
VDKLTDHELQILREINGDLPASSWGAWVGACYESLSGGGYITREGITEKGKQYLATASLASASAGNGELEPRCRDDKLLPTLKECILTLGAALERVGRLEQIVSDLAKIERPADADDRPCDDTWEDANLLWDFADRAREIVGGR